MSAKVEKTGSCSFCGQTKIIQVPEEWEQGQINEAVTCECECEQAQAYAKAKERKDKAKKMLTCESRKTLKKAKSIPIRTRNKRKARA